MGMATSASTGFSLTERRRVRSLTYSVDGSGSRFGSGFPHFDHRRIEGCSSANIRKALRGQQVYIVAAGRKLVPGKPRCDDTGGDAGMSNCRNARRQPNLSSSVEDLDEIAVGDVARCSIVFMHLEHGMVAIFHLLMHRQICEGGVHVVIGLAREKL